MRPEAFFSHDTAALLLGAPLPLPADDGEPEPLHVSVHEGRPFPRSRGVIGHRLGSSSTTVTQAHGFRLSTPASTWALLGAHSVETLVMAGDYFCRVWREGHGRPHIGRPPLTTRAKLAAALTAQRRLGAARLRSALPLIREDSWSPRESVCRLVLSGGGLPEPSLNFDIHDEHGFFVACADIAYPAFRVAVEYQGWQHGERYAKDIERIERLRAAGWIVIQITSELLADRNRLISRVREALLSRGWRP
jgi:hypothetical protein